MSERSLVIIESPYSGDVEPNTKYARAAMRDSLDRGEHPIASHLLYTQPGILDDSDHEERTRGIDAGLAWGEHADLVAFYVDRGFSQGMLDAFEHWTRAGMKIEARRIR